ncbi:hypothetical protein NPIL_516451 [Nephila pilipes]|uniref:Uncharacterized protein n=1 Tax=Nephila pilipes TaxID=299642 RepID=A0A8X6PQL3_NEPPI|nr:hypothetical protein NPIL_516451 [Nephila pilipes]
MSKKRVATATARSIKVPPFGKRTSPEIWFRQMESQFAKPMFVADFSYFDDPLTNWLQWLMESWQLQALLIHADQRREPRSL